MAVTLPMTLALIAGLSLLGLGAAATMGGGMGWDHASMMADGEHETMMEDHDHEAMSEEECQEGYEAHQAYMESGDGGGHCE